MDIVVAVCFAVMGLVGLVSPATVLELTGSPGGSPFARNEVRAVYGGIGLAVAVALLVTRGTEGGEAVRWAVGLLCFGMGMSRGVGLVVDWPGVYLPFVYLALELSGAAILLA
ncbi:MAG: DUF4345 family protein [Alphaproteobacteria bacterium]|nr:DUF4345 family protein [Alphaproteobacteria bacterium]MCB9693239.1 DUF4345 family protein [Alphaproteobacteria bacterium]